MKALGLRKIPRFLLGSGIWKESDRSVQAVTLLLLHIGSGTRKNSHRSPEVQGLRKFWALLMLPQTDRSEVQSEDMKHDLYFLAWPMAG